MDDAFHLAALRIRGHRRSREVSCAGAGDAISRDRSAMSAAAVRAACNVGNGGRRQRTLRRRGPHHARGHGSWLAPARERGSAAISGFIGHDVVGAKPGRGAGLQLCLSALGSAACLAVLALGESLVPSRVAPWRCRRSGRKRGQGSGSPRRYRGRSGGRRTKLDRFLRRALVAHCNQCLPEHDLDDSGLGRERHRLAKGPGACPDCRFPEGPGPSVRGNTGCSARCGSGRRWP